MTSPQSGSPHQTQSTVLPFGGVPTLLGATVLAIVLALAAAFFGPSSTAGYISHFSLGLVVVGTGLGAYAASRNKQPHFTARDATAVWGWAFMCVGASIGYIAVFFA